MNIKEVSFGSTEPIEFKRILTPSEKRLIDKVIEILEEDDPNYIHLSSEAVEKIRNLKEIAQEKPNTTKTDKSGIKEEVEKIIGKGTTGYPYTYENVQKTVDELTTYIEKAQRGAIEGFVSHCTKKGYRGFITDEVEEYLSQLNKGSDNHECCLWDRDGYRNGCLYCIYCGKEFLSQLSEGK